MRGGTSKKLFLNRHLRKNNKNRPGRPVTSTVPFSIHPCVCPCTRTHCVTLFTCPLPQDGSCDLKRCMHPFSPRDTPFILGTADWLKQYFRMASTILVDKLPLLATFPRIFKRGIKIVHFLGGKRLCRKSNPQPFPPAGLRCYAEVCVTIEMRWHVQLSNRGMGVMNRIFWMMTECLDHDYLIAEGLGWCIYWIFWTMTEGLDEIEKLGWLIDCSGWWRNTWVMMI